MKSYVYIIFLKLVFHWANFFARSEFFRGEKVETVRTHFFEEKRAGENCGAYKLCMSVLEKIRLVENRL